MRVLIVRHGDPNYEIDSLTEKGWKEAELLSDRLSRLDVRAFYVSPLGRARDTASLTLKKMGREAVVFDWLREFDAPIYKPGMDTLSNTWDWKPADWTAEEAYYRRDLWPYTDVMQAGQVKEKYEEVCKGLDKLLADHGYVRENDIYRAENPNTDTIVLFCHFGVGCVMLSHLLGISPMVLWHGFSAAPTSVTILNTEEREKGIAYFRMSTYGDTSHLYAGGEKPAFAGRFCEVYNSVDERHES
ncbi:MAG: histidine phosphatase family protein [Lachnospiraceae bacterium]